MPPGLLTLVANLPPISRTPALSVEKFYTDVVNNGGKFVTCVVDTDGKFVTCVFDTGGKFAASIVDSGGKFEAINLMTLSF